MSEAERVTRALRMGYSARPAHPGNICWQLLPRSPRPEPDWTFVLGDAHNFIDLIPRVRATHAEFGTRPPIRDKPGPALVSADARRAEHDAHWPPTLSRSCLYVLPSYGLELTRVGGTGDEGIEGIGTAPLSGVLSATVAVQAKRNDAGTVIARDKVALSV